MLSLCSNPVLAPTTEPIPEKVVLLGNTLKGISILNFPLQTYTLASLNAKDDIIYQIIQCESGWNPTACNKQYGCQAGMGLFQLIPSTIKYCEEKLGKPIDPFDANDNKECGNWLLTETSQGYYHWGYPRDDERGYKNGIRWGSYDCWSGGIDYEKK